MITMDIRGCLGNSTRTSVILQISGYPHEQFDQGSFLLPYRESAKMCIARLRVQSLEGRKVSKFFFLLSYFFVFDHFRNDKIFSSLEQ